MTKVTITIDALALTALWYFVFASPAQAYFDMGSGTYVVQVVLGFGAALWLSLKHSTAKNSLSEKVGAGAQDSAVNLSAESSEPN